MSYPALPSPVTSPNSDRIRVSKSTTISELLAAFSPTSQPVKGFSPQIWAPQPRLEITMTERGLRRKEPVIYAISDDSDNADAPSAVSSAFSSPQKVVKRPRNIIDLEEDELEDIEPPKPPLPRISSAGHSLRQAKDLHLSLRAQENGDKPVLKKRKLSKTRNKRQARVSSDFITVAPRTARNEVRDAIASQTTAKRASFFVAKKNYFLPLLPEGNHISRLVEQHKHSDSSNITSTVPYEALTKQPVG